MDKKYLWESDKNIMKINVSKYKLFSEEKLYLNRFRIVRNRDGSTSIDSGWKIYPDKDLNIMVTKSTAISLYNIYTISKTIVRFVSKVDKYIFECELDTKYY